jgi:energy-coupling factor transporter ATP-binding protein EcfA2
MIDQLHLERFTAFDDLTIDFSPKINIIIGENGTGKTQLLKAVYAMCSAEANDLSDADALHKLTNKFVRLFMPLSGSVGELKKMGSRGDANLQAEFPLGRHLHIRFNGTSTEVRASLKNGPAEPPAIFIPTKEVMSLARGLSSDASDLKTIETIFDAGYTDLAEKLFEKIEVDLAAKIQADPRFFGVVPKLSEVIGGRYWKKAGNISFQPGGYVEVSGEAVSDEDLAPQAFKNSKIKFQPSSPSFISTSMTAEGFRKIGVLLRLISNGSLNPGLSGPLLWDEPESNLNPKLMKQLVEVLLELSRNGQQIILATHDYVLLKWFDLLMDKGKGDQVRFFSLFRDMSTNMIKSMAANDYLDISPNPIDDAFGFLINQEIENDMGGLGK